MAYIEIKDISTVFGKRENAFIALSHVSLAFEQGEFICLLGPSGCGKTTLLNCIAGFENPTEGSIQIDGIEVKKPDIRHITIFQNYGLLPWRNVQKNVEFGLEKLKISKKERYDIAKKCIENVGLGDFCERYPHELSGGQQQRVAIARAFAVNPDILYMDEPFGALDAITRMKLQEDVLKLSKEQNKTILFVTHDIEEAVFLADKIVVLEAKPGRVKSIVNVHIPRDRDRTSDEFILARDKIYELLNMKPNKAPVEYVI